MADSPKVEIKLTDEVLKHMLASVKPNDAKTLSRLVNDAVVTYFRLSDLRQSGGHLLFSDNQGTLRKVVLPFEENAKNPTPKKSTPRRKDSARGNE